MQEKADKKTPAKTNGREPHPARPFMPGNATEMINANKIMEAMQKAMIQASPMVNGYKVLSPREVVGTCLMLAAWSATRPLRDKPADVRRHARREFMRVAMMVFDDGVKQVNAEANAIPVLSEQEFDMLRRSPQGSA